MTFQFSNSALQHCQNIVVNETIGSFSLTREVLSSIYIRAFFGFSGPYNFVKMRVISPNFTHLKIRHGVLFSQWSVTNERHLWKLVHSVVK